MSLHGPHANTCSIEVKISTVQLLKTMQHTNLNNPIGHNVFFLHTSNGSMRLL
jgi:hypothetical protein